MSAADLAALVAADLALSPGERYAARCENCLSRVVGEPLRRDVFGFGVDLAACMGCGLKRYDRLVVSQEELNDSPAAHEMADRIAAMGSMTNQDPAGAAAARAGVAAYYAQMLVQLRAEAGGLLTSLYEVGASVGDFLLAARRAGVGRLCGCEPNRRAAEIALMDRGLNVSPRFFAEDHRAWASASAGSWDAVAMLDTLEHTDEPRGDVERAASLLRPGGVLLVKTFFDEHHDALPDLDVEGPASRANWGDVRGKGGYFGPAGHLYHFDLPVLRAMLERAGLDVVRWEVDRTWGQVAAYCRRPG